MNMARTRSKRSKKSRKTRCRRIQRGGDIGARGINSNAVVIRKPTERGEGGVEDV